MRVLCVPSIKTRLPCGSLVCYLHLIVYTLSVRFFRVLRVLFPKIRTRGGIYPTSVGAWGDAPYTITARSEREAEPRIYPFFHGRGMGRSPIETVPHVRVRGAEMRKSHYIALPLHSERCGADDARVVFELCDLQRALGRAVPGICFRENSVVQHIYKRVALI